jgi:type I restriction enzyme, R subunit
MATSDTSEKALETLIVDGLCANGWKRGNNADYKPEFALDLEQLRSFIRETQPALEIALDLASDTPTRKKFLDRLVKEITNRGVIDVLRNGVKHGPHDVTLFYGAPSRGNAAATAKNEANRFTVVRQLHYSVAKPALSLDVCLMVNGLPVVTMELKNNLTKQSVRDAVEQYKTDRDPRELLFAFKRAMVHFAIDDREVEFCTKLDGKASWFLPFNQGFNDGAGNPPNPNGVMTAYLWEQILTRESFTDILENYAQVVEQEVRDPKTKKVRKRIAQIWPRFHQLIAVRKLLADAASVGAGKKYLVQHSAGSGKSNSIAWLVHQLFRLERETTPGQHEPIFDSVIVVTNRRILDKQINDTIKSFAQVGATIGHAKKSKDLHEMIVGGKKVIITTVQKFPFVVDAIGDTHRDRSFAIVIDEAHDSQSGKTAAALSKTLQTKAGNEDISDVADELDSESPKLPIPDIDAEEDVEEDDPVQDLINAAMAGRKMAKNASYFAFTATPKNKTLEMFGDAYVEDGKTKHRPFHTYTMKQATDEGFILDVLSNYTPVESYYKLVKTVESDPEFDTKRANKKLRAFVEGHNHAIEIKAGIIVDHFLGQVIAPRKIGGEARGMVVCGSIRRAIEYYYAISKELLARGGQYKAIVAFSGEHDHAGKRVSESSLNGFPSSEIGDRIQEDPFRILVCADKFQTGYDEPLLHTMYVDKVLSGVKAVQTLSRLNRAHPKKHDVFVLDFQNDVSMIKESFAPFYRTTILSDETDPNKLHDLQADLDNSGVYTTTDRDSIVEKFLNAKPRQELDPILDACSVNYGALDEDQQVRFKGSAKAFVRTYEFLGSILPYQNADWEKLSIFLNLLIAKLPAPQGTDLSKGILDAIDMDSYRAEKKATEKIILADQDTEIEPVPAGHIGGKPEAELDRLSNIIKSFNDTFGNTLWTNADRIARVIAVDIPARVNADERYQNAKKHSDKENARAEHDRALNDAMYERMEDESELFELFSKDDKFKEWLRREIFRATYDGDAA